MSDFPINNKGYWESTDSSGHCEDISLSEALIYFFRRENALSIVDLGCGMAYFSKALIENGFECDAYDGNPNTEYLTGGLGKVLDLSIPVELNNKYDWAMCFEVGEHIPEQFEKIFLDNVVNQAKNGIILSWAIPGQKGDGHVNCKTNRYISAQMRKRGWNYDTISSIKLRSDASLGWFKNTIMVYRRDRGAKSFFERLLWFSHLQFTRILSKCKRWAKVIFRW